jgi:hypothetical protein
MPEVSLDDPDIGSFVNQIGSALICSRGRSSTALTQLAERRFRSPREYL